MDINLISASNLKWANAEQTMLIADCVFSHFPESVLPASTTNHENEAHLKDLWERGLAGEFGLIETYIEHKIVPNQITPLQAKTVLLNHNLLDTVSTYIENLNGVDGKKTQLAWEFASSFDRDHPLITTIGSALNLTSEQIDDLFIEASKL